MVAAVFVLRGLNGTAWQRRVCGRANARALLFEYIVAVLFMAQRIEARQRAGHSKDDAIQRSNFELIAESWIELAEQVEWLERKLFSDKGTQQ